eukprot:4589537-Prymnesium_polylepis.1
MPYQHTAHMRPRATAEGLRCEKPPRAVKRPFTDTYSTKYVNVRVGPRVGREAVRSLDRRSLVCGLDLRTPATFDGADLSYHLADLDPKR